jgi:hypothetical protein
MFVLKLVAPICVRSASALGVTSQKHKRFVSVGLRFERVKETSMLPTRDDGASWEVSGCPLTVRACVLVTSLHVGTVRRDLEMPT